MSIAFDDGNIARMAECGITAFALEAAPRTLRAQSLDVLSSQANIAGYKAVMDARRRHGQGRGIRLTSRPSGK